MSSDLHVTGIFIHPVKSLTPVSLSSSNFDKRGLSLDRRWMMVDKNNHFISQRSHPQIRLCKLEMSTEGFQISTPLGQMQIPQTWDSEKHIETTMFTDRPIVSAYSGFANEAMSEFLKEPIRFCYQREDHIRPSDPDFSNAGDHFSLADGFPILVANQQSLNDLNGKLENPIGMYRFRPNIVVDGDLSAWEEDEWSSLSNSEISWRVVKPCARCSIVTVEDDGKFGKEPLKTLSQIRKKGSKVYFGMNIISDHSGRISVGDHLRKATTGSNG